MSFCRSLSASRRIRLFCFLVSLLCSCFHFCAQRGPVFSLFSFRYSTRLERFLIFAISGLFSLAPCLKIRCTRCPISFGYGTNLGHSHLDRATFFRAWFVLFLTVVIFQLIRLVYVIYILLLIFPHFLLQLHCQFLQNLCPAIVSNRIRSVSSTHLCHNVWFCFQLQTFRARAVDSRPPLPLFASLPSVDPRFVVH